MMTLPDATITEPANPGLMMVGPITLEIAVFGPTNVRPPPHTV